MLTSLSRLLNLKRISDFYNSFRDYIETGNTKHTRKMWDKLTKITEFKELIARERMEALKGNKTYIVAAIAGAATAAKVLGYIDEDTYQTIMGFLLTIGGVTIAAKMNRNTLIAKNTDLKMNSLMGINQAYNQASETMRKEAVYNPNANQKIGATDTQYGRTTRPPVK